MSDPVIRSWKTYADKLQRNGPSGGASTARNGRSLVKIQETWDDDTADTTNVWGTAVGGTGAVSVNHADTNGVPYFLLNMPAGSDTARLINGDGGTNFFNPLSVAVATLLTNYRYRRLIVEFMLKFGTLANQDNAVFMAGFLTTGASGTNRVSTNALGIGLSADALVLFSDKAGTEVEVTPSGTAPTLTDWNTYRITLSGVSMAVDINHGLYTGSILTTANHPVAPLLFTVADGAEAGGETSLRVGPVTLWLEE